MDPEASGAVVYVAQDLAAAQVTAADAAFFLGVERTDFGADGSGPIVVFPEADVSPYADASPDPRNVAARLACLSRLDGAAPRLIVVTARGLTRMVVPPAVFRDYCRTWSSGQSLERGAAVQFLVDAGYRQANVVEDPATYALRGAVLDVFVARDRFPTRIEFFGDEIESLRRFDPGSQRSLRPVEMVQICPARETIQTSDQDLRRALLRIGDDLEVPTSKTRQVIENLSLGLDFFGIEALMPLFHRSLVPLWAYFPARSRWYVDDVGALAELGVRIEADHRTQYARASADHHLVASPERFFVASSAVSARLGQAAIVADRLDLYEPGGDEGRALIRFRLERNVALRTSVEAARGQRGGELLRPLIDHIRGLNPDGVTPWDVWLVAPNQTHAERLAGLLRGHGVEVQRSEPGVAIEFAGEAGRGAAVDAREGPPHHGATRVRLVAGSLSDGFCSPDDRLLVVSEAEIFGRVTRKHRGRRNKGVGLRNLSLLHVGDYVVHITHGVARYHGLVRLLGKEMDFVHLEYAGQQKLYLPVYRVSEIERYLSAEAKEPKLDKMGGQTFAAKTRKVTADVRQMAEELLQIYAQRDALEGHAYPEPDEMYAQFQSTFPFEETPDQLEAIEAVDRDLGRGRPMDRLVCGDVGFGKTEVALRAAFRVAAAGKQVAVLAPTTVLVQQHYLTFCDRMRGFPLEVACLNRFQTAKNRQAVVERIASGAVDVVVGTHRILSRDVRFRDLGLVIVDEEQRFGVGQKERFKKLRSKVDVLTLTATPIPRTLHMGLLGLREISMIMTAPANRLAVKTYLTRTGDAVLEEGIRRELARGGQVFYVVPRVLGIEEHALRIRDLVPEARVSVAHGQMPSDMLERTMFDFVEHRADVLVSTTIIESGLDIPRANTMFIERADRFGLSQLYQLRGRIGRSRLRAHCYLLVHSLEKLSDDAKRRLEAIQRHCELGSGFNVAAEDLEIRGAGDLLGKRQAGSIQTVGFEAYARLLEEAVAELRGDPITREQDPELIFDAPAFLPDDYVEDTGQRLDFYRRLSAAADVDEVHDVLAELHDRFGDMPEEARQLGLVMSCKTYGRRLGALSLELRGRRLVVRLGPHAALDPAVAVGLSDATQGRMALQGGDRVVVALPPGEGTVGRRRLEMCETMLSELCTHTRSAARSR